MKKLFLIAFSNFIFAQSSTVLNDKNDTHSNFGGKEEIITSELNEAMRPFFATEKYGLGIIKYNATGDYSSTGALFKIFNPSKKTIKYIWFTIAGENPVGDLVKTSGTYYKTLKAIGPVESYGISTWSFDYVWLTDVVETLKLSSIKIQYMDGSVKTVKYNDNMYIGEIAYENFLFVINKNPDIEEKQSKPDISIDDQTVFSEVDYKAEFPGGINAFRNKITSAIESTLSGNANISFVVEKDGTLSDIKVEGSNITFNDEVVKSVNNIKSKWIPAKINSIYVRSIFRLPFTMNLE